MLGVGCGRLDMILSLWRKLLWPKLCYWFLLQFGNLPPMVPNLYSEAPSGDPIIETSTQTKNTSLDSSSGALSEVTTYSSPCSVHCDTDQSKHVWSLRILFTGLFHIYCPSFSTYSDHLPQSLFCFPLFQKVTVNRTRDHDLMGVQDTSDTLLEQNNTLTRMLQNWKS